MRIFSERQYRISSRPKILLAPTGGKALLRFVSVRDGVGTGEAVMTSGDGFSGTNVGAGAGTGAVACFGLGT